MAIIYVDSVAGSNTAPYDTWAKAAVLFQTALTQWASGDVIWMEQDHTEAVTGAVTYSGGVKTEPIPVYRMDNSDDSYAPTTGADTINLTTEISDGDMVGGNQTWNGLNLECRGYLDQSTASMFRTIDCVLESTRAGRSIRLGNADGNGVSIHSTLTVNSAAIIGFVCRGSGELNNLKVVGTINSVGLIQLGQARPTTTIINNADFSGITTVSPIMTAIAGNATYSVDYINCSFPAGYSLTDGSFGSDKQFVTAWGSGVTDLFPVTRETYRGIVDTNTVSYRDAGYVDADAATNLGHSMEPNTETQIQAPLESFEMLQWLTTPGTFSVTVEAVENYTTALQDDEAWMEVQYYDSTGSELTLVSTQVKAIAGTDLTAGTGLANWTGEPASSRSIKFEVTGLTVGRAGWIKAKVFLGKFESTKEFIIDPMMTIA